MTIDLITAEETMDLRQRVLRPGRPLAPRDFSQDIAESCFHLGAKVDGTVASIATFHIEKHPAFEDDLQYRLRGMATDPKYRRQGLGRKIIFKSFEILMERKCKLLWFNARVVAFDFYVSCGFEFYGPIFDLPETGPHRVMFKDFKPLNIRALPKL